MTVSCIIPAYNEAVTVGAVVRAVRGAARVDEIVVVSDGSTDETARRAARAGADRVVVLGRNTGKTGAVLHGLEVAHGDVIVLLDADLHGLTLQHVEQLLAPVLDGTVDMTVGELADDPWHELLLPLSGQRAVRRALLSDPALSAGAGFGLELALDSLAKRHRARVARVVLDGLTHRRKREKYGTWRGLRMQARASSDIIRQAGRTTVRRTPALRAGSRGGRPMVVALVLVAVLLVFAVPLFIAHPTRASELRLLAMAPLRPPERVLVVAAHPDDEVAGAGGLITLAGRSGVPVWVLVLTNGDSNRISAALVSRRPAPRSEDFIAAGRVRRGETLRALERLGVPADRVRFLGFPDRVLDEVFAADTPVRSPFTRLDHAGYRGVVARDAPYTRATLESLVRHVIEDVQPTIIVTHAPFDRHGDHRVAYEVVRRTAAGVRIVTYLIHAPGFPRPLRLSPHDPLVPPTDVGVPADWSWVRLELPADVEQAKRDSLMAYRSQVQTPYLHFLLTSFVRTNELFAQPPDIRRPRQ